MRQRATSRGQALPGKRPDERTMRAMVADGAAARCERCNGDLLRWWKHCPECGAELEWDEAADAAGDQTTLR
jgi:uncharacterized protein (DUF983 family)